MSITGAFLTARSGLSAAEAWADINSTNIANANRAGYARRSAPLTTLPGGGVAISGYQRATDTAMAQAHRREISRVETQAATATALETYTAGLGEIDSEMGLPGRIASFQTQLDTLAITPSDPSLQRSALRGAEGVASALRDASNTLNRTETAVETAVAADVDEINGQLERIVEFNKRIAGYQPGTEQRATLEDQMSETLDALARMIDVRVDNAADGRISIHTAGGAPLVEDNQRYDLEFVPASQQPDGRARLSVNGVDITPGRQGALGSDEGALAGRLGFLANDLPKMQLQLDELARGLVESFEAHDDSLAPGEPGLFVFEGGTAAQENLASRIAVNPRVDPERGGALWRIRDGLGAEREGPAFDGRQVARFVDALTTGDTAFAAEAGLGETRPIGEFAAGLVSSHQQMRNDALSRAETLSAGRNTIESSRRSVEGVNVDDELQQLMLVEQSYAANATVMRTLNEMMDTLFNAFR